MLEKQLYDDWADLLGLTLAEHRRAVGRGLPLPRAVRSGPAAGGTRGARLSSRPRTASGIVLLGRPYHNDPGVEHEISAEFQRIGYPVFTQDSLPIDADLHGATVRRRCPRRGTSGRASTSRDVWKNSYSENTSRKVWAAKYVGAPPESGRARAVVVQVRARRADLHGRRGDRPDVRHAVLLLQGHRREQSRRVDQDPCRDDRVLPAALPRGSRRRSAAARARKSMPAWRSSRPNCVPNSPVPRQGRGSEAGRPRHVRDLPREPVTT